MRRRSGNSAMAWPRYAVLHDGLLLHSQPKADLKTGRVCGMEALARWQHPERGFIPPDQFIPLAEQTGLIVPLTRWVLEAVVRQCRHWQTHDQEHTMSVAVNLSTRNLHDPSLPETIAHLLQTYTVDPRCLRVEVTESTLMADTGRAEEVLTRLAHLGVGISVDDYETGYSSLAYLKRLPVEEIKIDRSFVREMRQHEANAVIVASTISLAHNLGLHVVAEGVEDGATWDALAAMGCDVVQGYYLSSPLPADAVDPWLRDAARIAA